MWGGRRGKEGIWGNHKGQGLRHKAISKSSWAESEPKERVSTQPTHKAQHAAHIKCAQPLEEKRTNCLKWHNWRRGEGGRASRSNAAQEKERSRVGGKGTGAGAPACSNSLEELMSFK